MKKILMVCLATLSMFAGACTDDPTGSVAYTVDFSRLGDDVAEVRIVLEGADMEVSAAVSAETTIQGVLAAVPVGTYDTLAEVFAEGATQASATVSGSVTVEEDVAAILDILFGSSTIESISVSNNTPGTGEVVKLTANLGDDSAPQLLWSDDCAGDFISNGEVTVEWSNAEAETCTISVQLASAEASATTTELQVGLAKGTRVLLAGNGDCLSHSVNEYDDGATRVTYEVWNNNGFYIDETGMGAKSIGFDRLTGLDLDSKGRVVFADRNGGHILRIENNGTLTRLAGTARPEEGRANSSGPATLDTNVYWPFGVAVSRGTDDVYFAEAWGYRGKRINADDGTIETVIGNSGGSSPNIVNGADATSGSLGRYATGIAVDSSNGDYFIGVQYSRDHLYRVYGGTNTAMTLRTDLEPWDIEIFGDDLIITERHKQRVIKISKNGGDETVLAGEEWVAGFDGDGRDGRATLINNPRGLFVSDDGTVYFADTGNNRIRMIRKNGVVETVLEDAGVVSDLVIDGNGDIIQTRHDTCSVEKVIGPF